ncbi:hypothetical protein [Haloarcula sp. Atlit-7R]|uniref:hypothetical protein n=2 Tax=Haloarculaceae TaxID=1963268 RepID=UPI0011C47E53|nr:hypothetical protein [Haloarcula sp. Atlit-7R]
MHEQGAKLMQRRKFLIGLGSLAAGTAAATGTGAFSTVQASRNFTVGTTGDASAELALEGANNEYVTDDGVDGELEITFDNLNPDAVTGVNELFTIKNNADHSVEVWGDPDGPHADKVVFVRNGYTNDSQATLRQSDPPSINAEILDAEDENGAVAYTNGTVGKNSGGRIEFGPGKQWSFAMIVDTRGIDPNEEILDSVTVFADNFDS